MENKTPKRRLIFSPDGWRDYCSWEQKQYAKKLRRINDLLEDIVRNGAAKGIGKPERLRHIDAWSRRIDDENRLVYTESDEGITILFCRGHYEDL